MLLKRKALTAALLSQLCVSAMAAAQGNQPPAGQGTAPAAATDQTTNPAPDAAIGATKRTSEEEIVVTGSRIRRKDLTTPAPVTVISREQVVASGKVSIGDFLQSLPEQGNAINTSVNNGGDGSTRVNLRGLGTQRTLVLLNGRRMVPGGTGADGSVDLNSIPTASIERIEILKDGASAVYGSDAIAGVVNIITRRNYRQTELSAYTGTAIGQHYGDGNTYDLNVTTGTGGDRGNITFSAGYYNQQPVWAGDRDFAAIPRTFDQTGQSVGTIGESTATGSGTIPQGRIVLSKAQRGVTIPGASKIYNDLVSAYPTKGAFIKCTPTEISTEQGGGTVNGDTKNGCVNFGGWRPFIGGNITGFGGDLYNFQPQNYLVTPQQRISLYSAGDARLGSFARGFFEAHYVNRQSDQKLAPEPLLTDVEGVTISAQNPYNPFGTDVSAFRRRLLEFGNRTFNQDISTIRIVGGFDGTLSDDFGPLGGWFWEAAVNFGRTQSDNVKHGNLYIPNLASALGAQVGTTGLCSAGGGSPVPCLNLFGGVARPITPDQIENLTFTGTERGINQMTAVTVNTSGELPLRLAADRGVGLALGYEFRVLKGSDTPDPITVAGLTTGNKGNITSGSYYVNEGYAELSLPLVANMPFVQNLEATAAARIFKYSTFGGDYTYKFGGRYTPVRDITVRGTYSTAFRAPSISDLFLGNSDSFPNVTDPCKGAATPTTPGYINPTSSLGQACGPAVNNLDDQTQHRERLGGNPQLQPETAKEWTLGLVLEPTMVKNLTITVDYYNITVENSINTITAAVILQGCYFGGNSSYCGLVLRDPSNQRITNIIDTNQNVGKDETDGVDVSVRYAYPSEYGRFGALADVTWLHKFDRTLADGSILAGRGNFDLATTGGVYPAWKGNFGLTWSLAGFGAGVLSKWIGSFHECGADGFFGGGSICTSSGGTPQFKRLVPAYVTFDLYANYTLRSTAGRTTLAAGVNNVGDHKPGLIYNGFLAATDPTAYDVMGRFGYVRLSHNF
jgi:iron complex outermembrane recepter protein